MIQKGSPVSHDVHLGCSSDAGRTSITEFTAPCSHKKKFTLWWILPGFTFSTITNSTCQPIFGIHNFTIPIKYHSLILKTSTGMIQKAHLFLMMFTRCSPDAGQTWITEFTAACSYKKKFSIWWILPGFTFSTITNSTRQPIFCIHNFTLPINYHH